VTSLEDRNPLRKAEEVLQSAAKRGFGSLYRTQRSWWKKFWGKSFVEMDDKFLQRLWYVSLYNLATNLEGSSRSRALRSLVRAVDTPSQVLPWKGYYTNDYNTQLAVKPVFRANHPELSDGYFLTLLEQLPQARKNAKELFGLPGAYYPLSTDPTGEDLSSGPYRFCQCGGPYWGVILWWRYLHTLDEKFLRDVAYPILREVSTFFANYMRYDEKQKLYHLVVTQPPEYMSLQYSDPPFTIAPLKVTLKAAITCSRKFNADADLVKKWQHVLDHFPPYPTANAVLIEARDFPPDHWPGNGWRFPLYPCADLDPEMDPSVRKLLVDSLERAFECTGIYAVERGLHIGWTGNFHMLGMPAIWLGARGVARKLLEDNLKYNLKPNGLISHNLPFGPGRLRAKRT